MPYTIKTTLAFAGFEQGWTETFYWSQNNTDLTQAETTLTPIFQKRAKLLAKGYTLTVVRNAVVVGETNNKIKRRTDLIEPRIPGNEAWQPATPNLALYCLWQTSNNTQSKAQYMRGIPAGVGDYGKLPDLGFGGFLSAFSSWRTAMVALPAGWMVTEATAPNTAIIESYLLNEETGIVTFTLKAPGLTWPQGVGFPQRVYASLPGKSPLDGPIVVIPGVGLTATTAEPVGVAPFQPGQLGIMKIRTATLVTLGPVGQGPSGSIHPQRVISHKTGRPSFASRGKAAARPKW